jgi:membrane associated rhomboid family serine protease
MTPTNVGMRCPECGRQRTRVMHLRSMATKPRVTYALIAVNVLAFLAERGQFSIAGTGVGGSVVTHGVLDRFDVAVNHEYWRLVTSAFLHENLLHIAFNMYLLYLLGMMLEPALGALRFAAIYVTALLAGSFGALLATASPSLGASGAVFGLMAAAAVELRARRLSVMQSGIGGLILINLIFSFTFANISVGAHVGGLIGGALAALALRTADRQRAVARRGMSLAVGLAACGLLCALAVVGALAAAQSTGSGFA